MTKRTITMEYPCVAFTEEGGRLVLTFTAGPKKAVVKCSHYMCSTLSRKLAHHLATRIREAKNVLEQTKKAFHRGVEMGENGESL